MEENFADQKDSAKVFFTRIRALRKLNLFFFKETKFKKNKGKAEKEKKL